MGRQRIKVEVGPFVLHFNTVQRPSSVSSSEFKYLTIRVEEWLAMMIVINAELHALYEWELK
jgi:hypothetical protein